MRLMRLKITSRHGNLSDFEIDFEEQQRPTVLVGKNGTGKSYFFEALVHIFVCLDQDVRADFNYELKYSCSAGQVEIIQNEKQRKAFVDSKQVAITSITKPEKGTNRRKYLPKLVFAYYSGQSERLSGYFKKSEKEYRDGLLYKKDRPQRRFLFANKLYGQFALLAFAVDTQPETQSFLHDYLNIRELESAEIILKKPSWTGLASGDSRFWNAEGVVADYLDKLSKTAILVEGGVEQKRYWFKSVAEIRRYVDSIGDLRELFRALDSIAIFELFDKLTLTLIMTNGAEMTWDKMSEGEQQLLSVLGLLRFTEDDDSLFVMDEPDTHLNPAWKQAYTDLLVKYTKSNENSHVIFSTHDPLVIGNLNKEQLRVFARDRAGEITAFQPLIDPIGMGVEGVLTSDMFGLRSGLDNTTQGLLEEKRSLHVKQLEGEALTNSEKERFDELKKVLGDMEFTRTSLDYMYDEFVRAMSQTDYYKQPVLSPEQIRERDNYALVLVRKILAEKR